MRLGISSYTFSWSVGVPSSPPPQPMSAFDLLDYAQKAGIGVVQIADNLPLHKLSDTELTELANRAKTLSIAIEVGTRGIERDHLLTYLRMAERLESPILRTLAVIPGKEPEVDEVIDRLKPIISEFESRKITLAIENHDQLPAPALAEIIERLDSDYAGICLDTVNSFGALEGTEVVVNTLAPYVVNLHVKDFVIYRATHMMGFTIEGTPAGQGRLNVPWLLDQLSARRREHDFNAILEHWTPPDANVETTVAKERAWADQSITYLRTLIPD